MARSPRAGAPGAPIALQIMGLLLAGIVAAHALNLIVVMLVPPPRPPVWRIADIASALKGGPLSFRDGQTLQRRIEAQAPAEENRFRAGPWRMALAQSLGLTPDQVRFSQRRPPGLFIATSVLGVLGGRHGPEEVRFHRRFDGDVGFMVQRRMGEGQPPPPPPPPFGPEGGPDAGPHRPPPDRMILLGDFQAAARMADGRWTVVASPPEPFPSDWQLRIMVWFALILILIVLAGYLFGRRITAPIRAFADAAERLGRDPRQGAIPLSGPAEIGKAAAAFN
ncbi:MAG TPA: HAMP domain-containing protein, partial [Caulobacteraceae bacterium]|nr:HAMP domain-containing protein [Caulobacteraceae bacterium]